MPQSVFRLRFQIEHVIARQHGGSAMLDKGPNIAGIDRATGQLTRLFNPRTDEWSQHFRWEGPHVIGTSPIGRVTIAVLAMNHVNDIAVRLELIESGRFPPLP